MVVSALAATMSTVVRMTMSMAGTLAFPPRQEELLEDEDLAGDTADGEGDVDSTDAEHDDSTDNGAREEEACVGADADDDDDGGDDALDSREWDGVGMHF